MLTSAIKLDSGGDALQLQGACAWEAGLHTGGLPQLLILLLVQQKMLAIMSFVVVGHRQSASYYSGEEHLLGREHKEQVGNRLRRFGGEGGSLLQVTSTCMFQKDKMSVSCTTRQEQVIRNLA